jgi:hypothetical protein
MKMNRKINCESYAHKDFVRICRDIDFIIHEFQKRCHARRCTTNDICPVTCECHRQRELEHNFLNFETALFWETASYFRLIKDWLMDHDGDLALDPRLIMVRLDQCLKILRYHANGYRYLIKKSSHIVDDIEELLFDLDSSDEKSKGYHCGDCNAYVGVCNNCGKNDFHSCVAGESLRNYCECPDGVYAWYMRHVNIYYQYRR